MEQLYWVWLGLRCMGLSHVFDKLIRHYRSPLDIYHADADELEEILGKNTVAVARLSDRDLSDAARIMDYCMVSDIGILTYGSEKYPARLRMLVDPPVVLYYKGELPVFDGQLFLTLVGTRRMSEYGKRMTFEIAYDLARAGAVVVTGMALGVDGLAAASAIEAGGKTVAFLGSGIDIVYPPEHQYLMQCIIRHGAVITEYPPGTRPEARNFPHRNRLMSGIAQGVLMLEGNRKSGALITARCAEKQGRDLFALPGNADEENSEGPTLLLKNGAVPISCADDIVRRYEGVYGSRLNIFKLLEPYMSDAERVIRTYHLSARNAPEKKRNPLSNLFEKDKKKGFFPGRTEKQKEKTNAKVAAPKVEKEAGPALFDPPGLKLVDEKTLTVYRKIPIGRSVTVDELCTDGLNAGDVMAALTMLEIHRCVCSLAGGRYVRV